jgi:periodic tryptophan protein 2
MQARKHIGQGRLMSDRRTAGNSASGAFTSLQYSADGSLLFAGGSSKWVCVYDTAEKVLLQRFQLSKNLALDGVLDQLNSKNLTDAGPLDLLDVQDDTEDQKILPIATPGSISGAEKLPGAVLLFSLLCASSMLFTACSARTFQSLHIRVFQN